MESNESELEKMCIEFLMSTNEFDMKKKRVLLSCIPFLIQTGELNECYVSYSLDKDSTVKSYPNYTDVDIAFRGKGISVYISDPQRKKKRFDPNDVFVPINLYDLPRIVINEIFRDIIIHILSLTRIGITR